MADRPLALVTGASSGIGLALAREFASNGHDLVITATDEAALARAADELGTTGARVRTVAADLTKPKEVERLFREASSAGAIGVLAANAGIGSGGGDITQTDLKHELKLVDLNVRSQVHLIKLVARAMVARGEGRILVTSSIASATPGPFEAVYAASKAFLRSFGEAIRNELADKGIVVTVLMPGPTETDFFHRAHMDGTPVGQQQKDDPAAVARQGYQALMAGRHHQVAAGAKVKAQAAVSNLLSDPAGARVSRKRSEPVRDRDERGSGGGGGAALAFGAVAAAAAGAAWLWNRRREEPVAEHTRLRLLPPSGTAPASAPAPARQLRVEAAPAPHHAAPSASDIRIGG